MVLVLVRAQNGFENKFVSLAFSGDSCSYVAWILMPLKLSAIESLMRFVSNIFIGHNESQYNSSNWNGKYYMHDNIEDYQ